MKRNIWKGDLDELYDISKQNVLDMKSVLEEDKAFLISQREDRMSSSMSGVDKRLAVKERNKSIKEEKEMSYKTKYYQDLAQINKSVVLEDSTTTSSEPSDVEIETLPPAKKNIKLKLLDKTLTSTWDREQLSVRQASTSFIAAAKSLGHDVTKIAVSPATVYRARLKNRSEIAQEIENTIYKNPPYLVLHWDSKLLPSFRQGKTLEDRVAVLVTGKDFEQLLAIPVAQNSTGEEMAKVVMEEVDRLGLRDKIIGLSFDTTASNTGVMQGACARIERQIGRTLLWLACRHHTHELILKGVFEECLTSPSSGPDIQIFKKLQSVWPSLDKTSYSTIVDLETPENVLKQHREKMILFLQDVLNKKSHPREDYKEFLELSLLYLGGWSGSDFSFRLPGALHQARWMAKAIYDLKITLFSKQLDFLQRELNGMRRVAKFVSLIYVRFWHEATMSRWAPKNDLEMLQLLNKYSDVGVKNSALKVAKRHLWYLSEISVGLAFLDERLSQNEKNNMIKNLENPEKKDQMKKLVAKNLVFDDKDLSYFVTKKTKIFFEMFNIHEIKDYFSDSMQGYVNALQVVNDTAERGVALIKKYNESTKDEKQKQYLLKVVEHHRKCVPQRTKDEIASFQMK